MHCYFCGASAPADGAHECLICDPPSLDVLEPSKTPNRCSDHFHVHMAEHEKRGERVPEIWGRPAFQS